jgi:16S rRNA processing protein RimM
VLRLALDVDGKNVERLIPFVKAYIDQVDLPGRRVVADWGLDY